MDETTQVEFEIQRSDEGRTHFTVQVSPGMTILEGLLQIRTSQDASLAWRFSCRMGVCGSCAMVINDTPGLACNTQILNISQSRIRLRPLSHFPVIRDLATDLNTQFEKHRAIQPYIQPADDLPEDQEYAQSPAELLDFLQFADCIKCGACMSVCPTLATDERFPGPMPLTAAHRYNRDSRDQGFSSRRSALAAFHDVSHCHYAAECSRVCPKGVDPARAIQLLKKDLLVDSLGLRRENSADTFPPAEGEAGNQSE